MCIILDANCFNKFNDKCDGDMEPVRNWLYNRNGKIAYSTTEKFQQEWKQGGIDYLGLNRAGKLKLVETGVEEKAKELKGNIKSNAPHIIALAIVANVKVLVSEDRTLIDDFTNRNLVARGSVYQRAEHAHLLTSARCP